MHVPLYPLYFLEVGNMHYLTSISLAHSSSLLLLCEVAMSNLVLNLSTEIPLYSLYILDPFESRILFRLFFWSFFNQFTHFFPYFIPVKCWGAWHSIFLFVSLAYFSGDFNLHTVRDLGWQEWGWFMSWVKKDIGWTWDRCVTPERPVLTPAEWFRVLPTGDLMLTYQFVVG